MNKVLKHEFMFFFKVKQLLCWQPCSFDSEFQLDEFQKDARLFEKHKYFD